jgi:hypothetical protein
MTETCSFSALAYVIAALNINFASETSGISKLKCERRNPFVVNIFHVKFIFFVTLKES